jgi:hypothetical protein
MITPNNEVIYMSSQTTKQATTAEDFIGFIKIYCDRRKIWLSEEQTLELRTELARIWPGDSERALVNIFGIKAAPLGYGVSGHVHVYSLPTVKGIPDHPQIAKEYAEAYGYAVMIKGRNLQGVQVILVERDAFLLDALLGRLEHISQLRS